MVRSSVVRYNSRYGTLPSCCILPSPPFASFTRESGADETVASEHTSWDRSAKPSQERWER